MYTLNKIFKYGIEFIIDHIIAPCFLFFPTRNTILLESVPSMSDSTYKVYEELLKRGINRTYKIVWWLYDECDITTTDNVVFIDSNVSRIRLKYYEYTSKCIVSCNRFLEAHSKRQKAFYIAHGSPLKNVTSYYFMPKGINYFFCASEGFRDLFAEQLHTDPEKGFCLGLPRNDDLGQPVHDPLSMYFDMPDCKSIVWYPTFRQHKTGVNSNVKHGLPIIHDETALKELNDCLIRNKVIAVIKPHFAQDLSKIKTIGLSNIFFIDDSFFKKNNISSYEMVNSGDALISDYSSVYYDYLLCDKPIGLVWEDIDDYRDNPGFAVDIDHLCKGGVKIYTISDLLAFVENVANGVDDLRKERAEVNAFVNYSNDHLNTLRVTDKILELSGIS